MTDLFLKGDLNLVGQLKLASSGGKVKVGEDEVMVVVGQNGPNQGTGIPVIIPPPPSSPADEGTEVRVIQSFNSGVTIKGSNGNPPVVALGIIIQGTKKTWPGMVLLSTKNSTVKINGVAINVKGDSAITLPNAGNVIFDQNSGQ